MTWELYHLEDLLAEPDEQTQFLVDPYVPRGGTILFYGKASIGKSPLTWELARCVSQGLSFLGCPTTQGSVLYLDSDTPKNLVKPRMRRMHPPLPSHDVRCDFAFTGGASINILDDKDVYTRKIIETSQAHPYDLVIVNTLRKSHRLDDKDSATPSLIFGAYRRLFPRAALWFTHHDKKSSSDPRHEPNPDEQFSGSMALLNDCTVGLHLEDPGGSKGLRILTVTKSQVSSKSSPLRLRFNTETAATFYRLYTDAELWARVEAGESQSALAREYGVDRQTVSRALERHTGTCGTRPPDATGT